MADNATVDSTLLALSNTSDEADATVVVIPEEISTGASNLPQLAVHGDASGVAHKAVARRLLSGPPQKKAASEVANTNTVKRRVERRAMVCGYPIDRAWASARGREKYGEKMQPDMWCFYYTGYLWKESGLDGRARGLRCINVNGRIVTCIALADNRSKKAMKLPPQEYVDKLRDLMELTGPPGWYPACD